MNKSNQLIDLAHSLPRSGVGSKNGLSLTDKPKQISDEKDVGITCKIVYSYEFRSRLKLYFYKMWHDLKNTNLFHETNRLYR